MKRIILLSLVSFGLLAGGCNKTLDVDSTRVVNETNYWRSIEDARAGIMGVYGLTRAALADNNGHWIYGDVRMGNFDAPIRQDLKAIIRNDLNAQYPVVEELSNWRRFYAIVNAANIFLERIPEVRAQDPRYTENNMNVDVAQVRFLRAFAYFYMVRIWGDVPFIVSSREGTFENQPRTDQKAILDFVQDEMTAAAAVLPYRYSAEDIQQPGLYYGVGAGRWDGALVRKASAWAILAEVAAWQGKYADVSTFATLVINDMNKASLSYITTDELTRPQGIFYDKKINQLLAFGFIWGHQDASFAGNIESLTLAEPVVNKSIPDIFVPKDSILSIFKETNDARFNIDTTGITRSDKYFVNFQGRYPVFSKIKVVQNGSNSPNDANFRLFSSAILLTRLEEVTLLRAEAFAVLGETTRAIEDLNAVRQRRYNVDQMGLVNNNADQFIRYSEPLHGSVFEAIFKERQKEFMGEGHHFYDLVRYHKIKRKDPMWLDLINRGGIYWPVSRKLLAQNPLLTQNSYWK
ncbi:RagB/SusD family nutrient uptake outer membrane protein [Pedobacter deserti]|uniref:RagB/SusD family nutrient uptake outer membrane protein n=1 Tax=Pedobacter deserti TaxID=2817382 RepID=UPI00210EE157|nr:RagB/SusD family nutrient uptake outer membrane protein [Pedobacter sp. SYSU D00382]